MIFGIFTHALKMMIQPIMNKIIQISINTVIEWFKDKSIKLSISII